MTHRGRSALKKSAANARARVTARGADAGWPGYWGGKIARGRVLGRRWPAADKRVTLKHSNLIPVLTARCEWGTFYGSADVQAVIP
jgi:hypothetical protein